MKKLLLTLCASATLFSGEALAYYQNSASATKKDAPELETKSTEQWIWNVSDTSKHYVKISGGDNTVQYTNLFVGGGSGDNHSPIIAMGDGAVLELSNTTVMANNESSKAWATYGFETLSDTDKATIKLTNVNGSIFALSYNSAAKPFPEGGSRGVNIGENITVTSVGDIKITDNLIDSGGDFTLNGNITAGKSGANAMSVNDTRFSQGANSVIKASWISVDNTSDTVKRDSVFSGEIITDKFILKNAKATLTKLTALTSGSTPVVELKGGKSTLVTATADTLASVRITEASDTSSALKIANDMSVLSFIAPNSTVTVDSGVNLTVGNSSEATCFNVGGTIKGMVKINTKNAADSTANFIESDITVDGGILKEVNGASTAYTLTARNATITVKNGGSIITDKFLGISNGGTYDFFDATSKFEGTKLMMGNSTSGDSTLKLASSSNMKLSSILVRDNGSKMANIILTKDAGVYELGTISFLRVSNLTIDLNGASVEIGKLDRYNQRGCTSSLVFLDFANELVKFASGFKVADDGTVLGVDDTTSIKISGKLADGTALTSGWSIDTNGYLFNINAVPEPAEWAAIFGTIALGFAIYRRRK